MSSTKINIFYSILLAVSNYLFPLITYPYLSRVLGVTNIGICNYVDGIVNYFVLFSTLGVLSLGIREIAKCKNDHNKLNAVFSSLFVFNVALTIVAAFLLVFATLWIPSLLPYKQFLLFGLLKLLFNPLLIEWLFQGLSDFKYITIRSVIIKVIFVIAVFLFVRVESDALIYYILLCSTTIINGAINWVYSKKRVKLSISLINFKPYAFAIFSYGLYRVLTSFYSSFNVVYLGFTCGDTEVGYFSTATKLYSILMGLFTAVTTVLVPKVSELLGKGDMVQLKDIARKTFEAVFSLCIPLSVVCFCYAPLIINTISGPGYEGAILPFRIVMILLIVVALEQIIIQQFLMALKDTRCITILSALGAVVGVTLNVILTKNYASVGSSISWIVSEIVVLITGFYFFYNNYHISLPLKSFFKNVVISIPYFAIVLCFYDIRISTLSTIGVLCCLFWFAISNKYIIKKAFIRKTNK